MQVEKTGRSTGYTTGTVFDVSATVPVDFDLGTLTFEDQILIRGQGGTFSDGGDFGFVSSSAVSPGERPAFSWAVRRSSPSRITSATSWKL